MTSLSLVFDPHLPWPVLLVAALLAALALGWGLWRRAKGIGWRLAFLTLLLLALANPTLRREEREQLPDTVLLVKDRSPSQRLPGRQLLLPAGTAPRSSPALPMRWPRPIAAAWAPSSPSPMARSTTGLPTPRVSPPPSTPSSPAARTRPTAAS